MPYNFKVVPKITVNVGNKKSYHNGNDYEGARTNKTCTTILAPYVGVWVL